MTTKVFAASDWDPAESFVLTDEVRLDASYAGLDLNWSPNTNNYGVQIDPNTIQIGDVVLDLSSYKQDFSEVDRLRLHFEGTGKNDTFVLSNLAETPNFKTYWRFSPGDDIVEIVESAGLTLNFGTWISNFVDGEPNYIPDVSYNVQWTTDHYAIDIFANESKLGITKVYGPVYDLDISSDTTLILSDEGEHVEYISGKANVTMGEGTDVIQLTFEEGSTSADQLIIKGFSNTDLIEVSYDLSAGNAEDILTNYQLSEIVKLRHDDLESETYIDFQTPFGLIENYLVFDSLVYLSSLYPTDNNKFEIRLSNLEEDPYFSNPSWLGANTGTILAEWMNQFGSELGQFGVPENVIIKQSPDGSGVILDQLDNVLAKLETTVGNHIDSTGVYWYVNVHTNDGQFFQINGVNEYNQLTGEYSVSSKGIALRVNYEIEDENFDLLAQEFWPTSEIGLNGVAVDKTDIARIDHWEWYRNWLNDGNLTYEPEAHFILADLNGNPNWNRWHRYH